MKTHIRWGIIFSIVQTIFIAAEYFAGLHTHNIKYIGYGQLVFMFVAVTVMVLGLKARKAELGGQLAYTDSLLMGWVVGFVSGAIGVAVFLGYISWVNPEFFELAKAAAVEFQGQTPEQAEQAFATPNYYIGMFIFPQIAGTLTNAIAALFMKTKWKS